MEKEKIIETVNTFLIEELEIEPDQIKNDASLKDDLNIESLDLVDILVLIEKEFRVKADADELVKVISVEELYNFIEKRINH